ncbi:FAD-dependent oxidoreductase [Halobacillus naozhouensis]|uniref:FAD-dependent oxidoreductase n=1 Tax=Halobacillus naozhouensis TaxID=554880 RepID=A0ABY8IXH7_9BACI|nr:FAD-dependent oxidoreductase [Halobacillus naozhouensis]WFT74476.1 FAD-dependent oxidoreductase [Halobacillus naozhouensis]
MKHLLLVGAGHAHLYILKKLQKHAIPGVQVTLLSPNEYQYYSGMLSGCVEGIYSIDQIRIYVGQLVEKAGIQWKKDKAVSIDPDNKKVLTGNGESIDYDAVSFDIGSLTSGLETPGVLEYAETLKPNYRFPVLLEKVREAENLVIVGGGVAGTELALSLQSWRHKNGKKPLSLVSSTELMDKGAPYVSQRVKELLIKKGVKLYLHYRARELMKNRLILAQSNQEIRFDALLWLTGPRPPRLFAESSLPVAHGYLLVENTLQTKLYPSIFGAGDCIKIAEEPPLAKAGVYPVRQAPILWRNLNRFFNKKPKRLYKPHFSFLSILASGNREGLMLYKGCAFHGKLIWLIKTIMDRKFIWRYSRDKLVGDLMSSIWLKVIFSTLAALLVFGLIYLFFTTTYYPVMGVMASMIFSSTFDVIFAGLLLLFFIVLVLVLFFESLLFK